MSGVFRVGILILVTHPSLAKEKKRKKRKTSGKPKPGGMCQQGFLSFVVVVVVVVMLVNASASAYGPNHPSRDQGVWFAKVFKSCTCMTKA